MELTAATISVKVSKLVKRELVLHVDKVRFWTDSQTVLKYNADNKARYHTFVANRVNLIREGSNVGQ